MKDKLILDILPSYSYRVKIIGLSFLLLFIIYAVVTQLLHLNYIKAEIVQWLIAFSLILISFSKDKVERDNSILIRYYSGKIAITFLLGFIMGFRLADLIIRKIFSIDIITLIIVAMVTFQISYYILKHLTKRKELEIKETTVVETFLVHKKFYYLIFIASILTLAVIYLIGY